MVAAAVTLHQHLKRTSHDIIVVGTGPVGIHVINELMELDNSLTLAVFGDEPWPPYNRVKLTALMTGDIAEKALYDTYDLSQFPNVSTFYNNKITAIDRYAKEVIDSHGKRFSYKKLILATGSRVRIPTIENSQLKNIFTFRDLSDALKLMSRRVSTRHTVVIGGGLLGLEAARVMQRHKTQVHIIEHTMWMMFNQLDERAGRYLQYYVESLGINVHLNQRVKSFTGENKVSGVLLSNGDIIECDTVIIAAGIIPNNQLALESGIHIGKGIRVNNHLQTSDPHVYAIGECAEHNDKIYGLVAPGLEQAVVLAFHLNNKKAQYRGSVTSSSLKVLDYPVYSLGNNGSSVRQGETVIFQDHQKEIYRKLVIINGRLRGAVGIGDWPAIDLIQDAVEKHQRVWWWQIKRFRNEGILWI